MCSDYSHTLPRAKYGNWFLNQISSCCHFRCCIWFALIFKRILAMVNYFFIWPQNQKMKWTHFRPHHSLRKWRDQEATLARGISQQFELQMSAWSWIIDNLTQFWKMLSSTLGMDSFWNFSLKNKFAIKKNRLTHLFHHTLLIKSSHTAMYTV